MPGRPTLPALRGFNVRGLNGKPTIREYTCDPSGPLIRPGDPIKEVAGGIIQRASPADTALLGFGMEPSDPSLYVAREIPLPPANVDSLGRPKLRVAVADPNNVFQAAVAGVTSQSIVTKRCDLAFTLTSPQPTATPGGTTGAVTIYYWIVAVDVFGYKSAYGTVGSTTTANAALSAANYVDVSWAATTGADYFEVWKSTTNTPATASLLGTTQGTNAVTLRDIGQATTTGLINSINHAGVLINPAATATNVIHIQGLVLRPDMPVGATNGLVEFSVPASASQYLGVAGS